MCIPAGQRVLQGVKGHRPVNVVMPLGFHLLEPHPWHLTRLLLVGVEKQGERGERDSGFWNLTQLDFTLL